MSVERFIRNVKEGSFEGVRFFTTFVDANGREVFEGDTIICGDKEAKVEWVEKDFGFGALYWMTRYAEKTGKQIYLKEMP